MPVVVAVSMLSHAVNIGLASRWPIGVSDRPVKAGYAGAYWVHLKTELLGTALPCATMVSAFTGLM